MHNVAEMLLTEPAPAAIWAVLMLLTIPALLILGSPAGVDRPLLALREAVTGRGTPMVHAQRTAEAAPAEPSRVEQYAEEMRVAADRAAISAQRWQRVWEESEDELATAWQAWSGADDRLRAALAASAWGVPWSAPTCEQYASREHFLHRAVAAAVERGELPTDAVADALAGRNGWNAWLHPVEQELVIARASASYLRSRYQQAAATERAAWHDADLARRADECLRAEARAAMTRANPRAPRPAGGNRAHQALRPAAA